MNTFRMVLMTALALAALGAWAQEPTPNSLFLDGDFDIAVEASGEVIVSWKTLEPAPHGSLYIGLASAVADVPVPTYRRWANMEGSGEDLTTEHRASFDMADFERDTYDVDNLRANSGGDVYLRLVTWRGNAIETFHTRFAYQRDAEGNARRVPCITLGPVVDCVTDSGAILSWETDIPAAWEITLEAGGPEPTRVASGDHASVVETPVEGLRPQAAVDYRVALIDPDTGEALPARGHTFRTAPPVGSHAPFRFALMSDSRAGAGGGLHDVESTNWEAVRGLALQALRQEIDLMLFAGDLVNGYTASVADMDRQLRSWRNAVEPVAMSVPIYEGMGNHEYVGHQNPNNASRIAWAYRDERAPELVFSRNFVNPTNGPDAEDVEDAPPYAETAYSFDHGNAHFVSLNSNYFWSADVDEFPGNREGYVMEGQMEWLDADLADARARGQNHLFIYTHEPMFPNGGHLYDAMYWHGRIPEVLAMRDRLAEILSRHGALAIFMGDEHNYARMLVDQSICEPVNRPFWHVVSGGAGAPYYGQQETPWTQNVVSFAPINHFVLVEVDGLDVTLKAISNTGQVIEEADLIRDLPGRPAQ